MKFMKVTLPSVLLCFAVLLTSVSPVEAVSPPQKLTLQTGANTFNAANGNNQPVVIVVVASNDGEPVTNLGDSVNIGFPDPITLPSNWTLKFVTDSGTVCSTPGLPHIVPHLFVNQGDGIYRIQVIPEPTKGCEWRTGTVQYVVEVTGQGNSKAVVLGQFSIK
jgi:hypothetical protein